MKGLDMEPGPKGANGKRKQAMMHGEEEQEEEQK